jgi:ABC-type glycerol-3-phosphate transport system substrate-binding protein
MSKKSITKIWAFVLSLMIFTSIFYGCSKDSKEGNTGDNENGQKTVKFLHFNKDDGKLLKEQYEKENPDVKVEMTIISDSDKTFQTKLPNMLKSGNAGDVVALESAFVKRFVGQANSFSDLTKDPFNANELIDDKYEYTIGIGKDENGVIRALSHQACPGGLGYKRDLAKKYFGTDDPDKISEMVSSVDKLKELGSKLPKGKLLFAASEDIARLFLGARETGWVKDNKLVLDPKIEECIQLVFDLKKEGKVGSVQAWKPEWDAAIKDPDNNMFFAIPTWGIPYIINSKDEKNKDKGKWGIAKPTYSYSWGGTWYTIAEKSENKEEAWKMIKFITSNKEAMEERARDTGDFGNSKSLAEELESDDTLINKTINQNPYKLWKPIAEKINGDLITQYDDICASELNDLLLEISIGKTDLKNVDEVMKKLKPNIENKLLDAGIEVD